MAIYFNEYLGKQLVAVFYFYFFTADGVPGVRDLLSNPDNRSFAEGESEVK